MSYLGTETKKGLGKLLREISIHPFRLDGSSESFIRRATLPPGFEWFALDSSRELIVNCAMIWFGKKLKMRSLIGDPNVWWVRK